MFVPFDSLDFYNIRMAILVHTDIVLLIGEKAGGRGKWIRKG